MATINTGSYGKKVVKVRCTDNGKIVNAELVKTTRDSITVVLDNFQKLILHKSHKPNFYVAQAFGMEFTCNLLDK